MIRICVECKKCYGVKEPLGDPSFTHGLCDACYNDLTKIREGKLQLRLKEVSEKEPSFPISPFKKIL